MFDLEKNSDDLVRKKITIISFMCSIFVVFIHAYNLDTYGITSSSEGFGYIVWMVETSFKSIVDMSVPVFYCISGFLFFSTFKIEKMLEKYYKRFQSLVVPYVIWCSVYYLYYVFCTNTSIQSLMSGTEIVPLSIKCWLSWLWENQYYTLWFLKNLIIFVILSPIIWLLLLNRPRLRINGFIALIGVMYLLNTQNFIGEYQIGLNYYLVGCYVGLNCKEYVYYKSMLLSLIGTIAISLEFVFADLFDGFWSGYLFILSIWFMLDWLNIEKIKIRWWMRISFFIYVTHDAILEAVEKIVWRLFPHNALIALADYIIVPLMVFAIILLIAREMISKVPCVWRIVTGNRGTCKERT